VSGSSFEVVDPLSGVLNSVDGTTPSDPSRRIQRLAEILGLSAEQVAALVDAENTLRTGLSALRDQVEAGTLTREQARIEARALHEAFQASMQLILTPEQWNRLQELLENRDRRGRGHHDPVRRWLRWLNAIDADSTQTEAVLSALEEFHDTLADIRARFRSGEINRGQGIQLIREARDDFDAALQEILTDEQYSELLEMRTDCPGDGPPGHWLPHDRGRGNGNGNGHGNGNGNGRGNGHGRK
jgi:Spy/CpxP family protein refolding chaperone